MEKKAKVLFFLQNGVGGAERMTINIANLLPREKYEIIICKVNTPNVIQNGKIDDFIPKDFKITNISWSGQVSFLRQIYKTLKVFKPDIVFSSVMPYNQRLLFIKPLFKNIKFIVRNDNYLFTISKFKRLSLKYTYRNADTIVAQTEEMKNELVSLGLNPDRIRVLHNFIDEDLILKKANVPSPYLDNSKIHFVSVGRIAHQKGYDILIKAYKKVSEHIPNSELYIIGGYDNQDPVYIELCKLIDELNLNDNIIFTGYTDNPYQYIKYSSVFVLSSRYEGLPNVLIESQFLKVPAAAVNCIPIIERIVKDGKNGYLANNEDPESLAEAMIKAIKIKDSIPTYKPSPSIEFIKLFNQFY